MRPPSHFRLRLGIAAILAAAAALYAYYFQQLATEQIFQARQWAALLVLGSEAVLVFASGLLSAALAWRAADRPDARALAIFLASVSFVGTGDATWLLRQNHHFPLLLDRALDLSFPFSIVVALLALVRFSSLFPRPLTGAELEASGFGGRARARIATSPRAVRVVFAEIAAVLLLSELFPLVSKWVTGHGLNQMPVLRPLMMLGVMAAMAAAGANLRTGYRLADEAGRRRIYWVLEGLLAATTIIVLASLLKAGQMLTGYEVAVRGWYAIAVLLAIVVLVVCLAIAMFFAGAIDPALAIRRTAVIGVVGLVTLFVFAGVEQLVQEYLERWLGLSDHLGGILTGGVVALTLDRVKGGVERALHTRRHPAVATPEGVAVAHHAG